LLSPLPTYAAIPLGISFIRVGVPFSAVMAFIIASPLMNPTIFFITATQISIEMALVRTIAAFVISLTGGFLTMSVFKNISSDVKQDVLFNQKPSRTLLTEIYRNSLYILKTFSVALLLSAAVKALIPVEMIQRLLGGNAKFGTLFAIALGVPFYSCGGAAVSFVQTLMELGMSKGATLAFFISGPVTKLETLYAYNKLLGKKVLFFYLVLTLVFAYVAGYFYSFF
jgi:uncharacterized membrane protein YraQ (UPF0718 family)